MTSRWYWVKDIGKYDLHSRLSEAVAEAQAQIENNTRYVVVQIAPRVVGSSWGDYAVIADEHGYISWEDALRSWAAEDDAWTLVRAVVSFQQVTSIDTTWYAEEP